MFARVYCDGVPPKRTYTAIASRDEKYWLVRVLGLGAYPQDGLPTQARTLAEVEPMARDLIAVYLDIPEDSFDVETRVEDKPPDDY
jgi:predicted RNase H-like HicB family nuclease